MNIQELAYTDLARPLLIIQTKISCCKITAKVKYLHTWNTRGAYANKNCEILTGRFRVLDKTIVSKCSLHSRMKLSFVFLKQCVLHPDWVKCFAALLPLFLHPISYYFDRTCSQWQWFNYVSFSAQCIYISCFIRVPSVWDYFTDNLFNHGPPWLRTACFVTLILSPTLANLRRSVRLHCRLAPKRANCMNPQPLSRTWEDCCCCFNLLHSSQSVLRWIGALCAQ